MTDAAPVKPARDTLLLSHANPEDNEFTLWLALQLANEGYRPWCDLTKLLGGEAFWDDVEEVIKTRAIKVLYVLSRTSNAKNGPLKELHFAQWRGSAQKWKSLRCREASRNVLGAESSACPLFHPRAGNQQGPNLAPV